MLATANFREFHFPRTPVNKPSADVPELGGWHHVWRRPVGEHASWQFVKEKEGLCRRKRRTRLSYASSSRRRGARVTWLPWPSLWPPTTWRITSLPGCRLGLRA